ncbi:uncharacterized protein FFNC_15432 [Fusarium fujikuroi]|nr:uncharacterized protein FFNC_15432 [Fusarium fujikuroi]SCV61384.1 uncharacterized protein FFFS_15953 [Fusarium fujikuroi]
MKVRFVGTRKRDSARRRRRALQANRTRNYRQRQKAREDTTAIKHQGESLSDAVDLVADNEAPGPERDSSLENDEIEEDGTFACDNFTISTLEVDDSTISATEVNPYYEEEIVDTSPAEEDESQTQPQSPQMYAEKSVDLATNDANNDVEYATQNFIQQFLTGIHDCGVQSHRESLIAHIEAEGPDNHQKLDRLVAHDVPHTLDKEYILAAETDDETMELILMTVRAQERPPSYGLDASNKEVRNVADGQRTTLLQALKSTQKRNGGKPSDYQIANRLGRTESGTKQYWGIMSQKKHR